MSLKEYIQNCQEQCCCSEKLTIAMKHLKNKEWTISKKKLGTCPAILTTGIVCSSAARFIDLTESTRDEVSSSELPLD